MKSSPGELKRLRSRARKEEMEKDGSKKYEKKLGAHESPQQRKFKIWVVWFIAIAFIGGTFLTILAVLIQKEQEKESRNSQPQKPITAQERQRDISKADLKYFKEQIEKNPDDPANYCRLASAYYSLGQVDDAIQSYEKAIKLDPKDTFALRYLARLYYDQKKYDKAREILLKALDLEVEENKQTIYAQIAGIDYEEGKIDSAIENIRKAIEKDKSRTDYYVFLVQFYLKKGDKKGAIKAADEGLVVTKAMNEEKNGVILEMLKQQARRPEPPDKERSDFVKYGDVKPGEKPIEKKPDSSFDKETPEKEGAPSPAAKPPGEPATTPKESSETTDETPTQPAGAPETP